MVYHMPQSIWIYKRRVYHYLKLDGCILIIVFFHFTWIYPHKNRILPKEYRPTTKSDHLESGDALVIFRIYPLCPIYISWKNCDAHKLFQGQNQWILQALLFLWILKVSLWPLFRLQDAKLYFIEPPVEILKIVWSCPWQSPTSASKLVSFIWGPK